MAKIITFSGRLLVAAVMAGGMACAFPALAADDGYAGVVAPSDDDTPGKSPAQMNSAPAPGYAGVTADTPSDQAAPTDQYTAIPHTNEVIQDLGTASMVHGIIERAPDVKAPNVDFSKAHHSSIAGKPAVEDMVENKIARAMASVSNKNISDDQRAENAKSAYKNLASVADGLRYKQTISDDTYKSLGLTDKYIDDERSGNANALTQLDAALATLKPLQ